MTFRPVAETSTAQPTMEGAGVHLHRVFGFGDPTLTDPFLMMDDFRNDDPRLYSKGFPWHPHRGIETITYVLEGEVEHADSLGNRGLLGPGSVQWMTAGSGIVHQEMPSGDDLGRMHGFQLWANLPSSLKMTDPRYQDITGSDIPVEVDDDGTVVKVIIGSFWGKTDPQTMDPHAVSSAPVLGFLNNVYDGLVRMSKDMKVEPSLATSWEPIGEGEGWRFKLRQGVTFHDGAAFDSDDVLFSYERASDESSDVRSWFSPVTEVKVVDDYTIEFYTNAPNPLFPASIANWMMMDRGWAEANDATRPDKEAGNFATLNVNGTGAFKLEDRQPGLTTTLVPNADWWDEAEHNITKATFTPIQNPATAVAALLSGDVDFVEPVPIQDAARLEADPNVNIIRGVETRVIMLGFAHEADELKYGASAGEPNPFQDVRVREAVAKAINVDAILQTIWRGSAEPASQLVPSQLSGFSEAYAERTGFDPEGAKALLADAGYAEGFGFGLKCPNDRYPNDESVCQAITAMLAQVGIQVELDAMPVSNYWPELREDNFDMYLLGWSPGGSLDHEHPLRFLASTPNEEKRLGSWNFGGYSNARLDDALPSILSEIDEAKRQALIDEVTGLYQGEHAYVPLYVQPLVWGTRSNIELTQRPDNFFILRWVTVN